jgi:hypothetical protein
VAWVEVRASALACAALPLGLHSWGWRVEEGCVCARCCTLRRVRVPVCRAQLLLDLVARGYRLSTTSFRGPWLEDPQLQP